MMNVVYNMDCMTAMKEMKDNEFDLAIVDPIYGDVTIGGYMKNRVSGGKAKHRKYNNSIWSLKKTGQEYFDELFRVSKNQIIWGGNYFVESIKRDSQCWVCWDKCRDTGVHYADFELAYTSFDRACKIFRYRWNGMLQGDMKNKEERIHPTQKPVALYKWLLENFAHEGDRILDTHLGSGSSRIACYDLGYDFVGYEIDKTYFDLQEERFQKHIMQQSLFDEQFQEQLK